MLSNFFKGIKKTNLKQFLLFSVISIVITYCVFNKVLTLIPFRWWFCVGTLILIYSSYGSLSKEPKKSIFCQIGLDGKLRKKIKVKFSQKNIKLLASELDKVVLHDYLASPRPNLIKWIRAKSCFYSNTVIIYRYRTNVPLKKWESKKDEIESILNTNILNMEYVPNSKKIINITTKKVVQNKTFAYKNSKLPLKDRIESCFDKLGIEVKNISINTDIYKTTINFDSEVPEKLILSSLDEFKNRMKFIQDKISLNIGSKTDFIISIYKKIETIYFKDMIKNNVEEIRKKEIPCVLGVDNSGNIVIDDIVKDMYHTINAGTTGGGKSNLLHCIAMGVIFSGMHNSVMVILDPKKTEFKDYRKLDQIVYAGEIDKIMGILKNLEIEMDRRNDLLQKIDFVRNVEDYNDMFPKNKIPYIIVIIEEIADLLCRGSKEDKAEFTRLVQRLVQLGRSTGFRLFLATQKPNADTLSTYIKTNCITRCAFPVSNINESRVILDNDMANQLTGNGTFVYQNKGKDRIVKSSYLPKKHLEEMIKFLKEVEDLKKGINML